MQATTATTRGGMWRWGMAAVAAAASLGWAQQEVKDAAPYWIATTAQDVQVRCGDRERYYAVAKLPPGTLLTADGESDQWVRVRYPEGVTPFAPKEDAKKIDDTTIELTRSSGLRAPSAIMGPAGSWRSVYDPPLAAGTTLKVVSEAKDDAGAVVGWMVEAVEPPVSRTPARGYVAKAQVRNATASEVEAHLAKGKPQAEGQAVAEKPAVKPAAQPAANTKPDATPAEGASDQQTASAPGTSLLEEQVPPGSEPEVAAGEADAAQDIVGQVPAGEGEAEVIDQTAAGDAAGPLVTPVEVPETGLTAAKLQDLEAAFDAARALPREELDVALDELLAEYRRAKGETSEDVVIRSLDQRIGWLELRIATRDERRKLESVMHQVTAREAELRQRVADWRSSRAFTIVGRVLPSRVYDGRRLPLMYRVESIEPLSASRTIGYIRPGEPDQVALHMGQIIGIRGEAAFDPELRMNVITPLEVETLDAAARPTGTAATPETGEGGPGPATAGVQTPDAP